MKLIQVCRCGEEISFELATDEILWRIAKWLVTERLKVQGWDVVKDDILCPECLDYIKADEEFDRQYAKEIKETDDYNYKRYQSERRIIGLF